MGKKLDKLVARIQALEKAIAAMVTRKKPKKSAKKKSAKAKTVKAAPKKKAKAKKPAPKRRARKAKPVAPPLPLAATL